MKTSLWNTSAGVELASWPGETGEAVTFSLNWWALLCVPLVLVTATGNILVCLAIGSERHLQNMTNYFLMSLAITDLMVAVLVMPLGIVVLVLGYFPLPAIYCLVWSLLDILFCTASIMHLCTLSIDRFLSLSFPMRFGRNKSRRRVLAKLLPVWLLSLGQCVPLCVLYASGRGPVLVDGVCAVQHSLFQLIGSVVCFYIPLCIMLLMYSLTVRLLNNKQKNHLRREKYLGSCTNCSAREPARKGKRASRLSICSQWRYKKGNLSQSDKMTTQDRLPDVTVTASTQRTDLPESTSHGKTHMSEVHDNISFTENHLDNCSQIQFSERSDVTVKNNICVLAKPGTAFKSRRIRLLKRSQSHLQALSAYKNKHFCPKRSFTSASLSLTRCESLVGGEEELEYKHLTCSSFSRSSSAVTVCLAKVSPEQSPIPDAPSRSSSIESLKTAVDTLQYCEFSRVCQQNDATNTVKSKSNRLRNISPGLAPSSYIQTNRLCDEATILQNGNALRGNKQSETDNPTADTETNHNAGGANFPNDGNFSTRCRSAGVSSSHLDLTTARPSPITRSSQPVVELVDANRLDRTTVVCRSQSFSRSGGQGVALDSPWSNERESRLKRVSVVWRCGSDRLQITLRGRSSHTGGCSRTKSTLRAEQKATKVLGVIFFTFVLLWSPFFTINVLISLCEDCRFYITGNVINFVTWLGYISSLVNPFFYTFFNRTFREAFKKILLCQRS